MMIDDFGLFWNAYPRKLSIVDTRRAWAEAITKVNPQTIIEAATAYACDPNRDPTYTPSPAKWLDGERWQDDPLPPRKISPDELKDQEIAKAKKQWQEDQKKAQEAMREAEEAKAKAVPLPPEIKAQLLAQWANQAYPKP